MSELFETIDANADQAAAVMQKEMDAAREEQEILRADRRRLAELKRKKATRDLLKKGITGVVLIAGLLIAEGAGCMVEGLTVLLVFAVFVWLAFWLGAWAQFMWGRGGLLNG